MSCIWLETVLLHLNLKTIVKLEYIIFLQVTITFASDCMRPIDGRRREAFDCAARARTQAVTLAHSFTMFK